MQSPSGRPREHQCSSGGTRWRSTILVRALVLHPSKRKVVLSGLPLPNDRPPYLLLMVGDGLLEISSWNYSDSVSIPLGPAQPFILSEHITQNSLQFAMKGSLG